MTVASSLNIAFFSPLPPTRSGIADYSLHLLPDLSAHFNLTLISDQDDLPNTLSARFPVLSTAQFTTQRHRFDLLLYQMGNSQHHTTIYKMACHFPGVVVFHDTQLHHFTTHRTLVKNDFAGFCREVGLARGHSGWAWQITEGDLSHQPDLPLIERLLYTNLGYIVHSKFAENQIHQLLPDAMVATIPALIETYPHRCRRDELGWPSDALIFASVGQITTNKQVEMALHAFARLRPLLPQARFLLVGDVMTGSNIDAVIAELALTDVVIKMGHVPNLVDFADWIATADIVINLRYPTMGETSATALRAMAAGKPVVVFDHGWYGELPSDACVKVMPMDENGLEKALLALAQNADYRQQIGTAAQNYVQRYCQPTAVAHQYATFLHHIWDQFRVNRNG